MTKKKALYSERSWQYFGGIEDIISQTQAQCNILHNYIFK